MTYCVALRLNRGLVFAADTRTSAGNDNVTVFRKLHYWRKLGERVVVLMSAGNLAVTQSVISILNEQLVEELSPGAESLFTVPSLYRAARLVGEAVRQVHRIDGPSLEAGGSQLQRQLHPRRPDRRRGAAPVPHLSRRQLHRGDRRHAVLPDRRAQVRQADPRPRGAAQHAAGRGGQAGAAVVRLRRLRSNLSVGLPIDLLIYERDSLDVRREKRIEQEDEYFRKLSAAWSEACARPSPRWRSSRFSGSFAKGCEGAPPGARSLLLRDANLRRRAKPADERVIDGGSATRPRAATLARCPAGGSPAGRGQWRPAQDLRRGGAGRRQDLRDAADGPRQAEGGGGRRCRCGRDARPQGDGGAARGAGGSAAQADHLRQPHPERVRHRRGARSGGRASSWSTSWRIPTSRAAATPSATSTSRSCWRTASTSTPPSTSSTSRA